MASALAAVFGASPAGGTIVLSPRAYSFADQWATTYSAGVITPLAITGAGAIADDGPYFGGATTVSMSYAGAGAARMDFQHSGSVEISGILFQDSGGSPVPFYQSTNPVPNIHDNAFAGSATGTSCFQDAIVLGGYPGTGSGDTAQYQGYAGAVYRNSFTGIRRMLLLNPAANGVQVYGNTVSSTCGSDLYLGACIEAAGTSPLPVLGCNIYGNCIEVTNYPFGIKGTYLQQNTIGPNGLFDPGTASLGYICLDANSAENQVIEGFSSVTIPLLFDPTAQRNAVISAGRQSVADSRSTLRTPGIVVTNPVSTGAYGEDYYGNMAGWKTALYQGGYPSISPYIIPGTEVTDGNIISGSNVATSLTAAWTSADIGERIYASGLIPQNTSIVWAWTPSTAFAWQPSLAYAAGQVTRPATANAHLYQCTTAGTSGSSQPAFPTNGSTVSDGTAVWTDIGASSAVLMTLAATGSGTGQNVFFGRAGTVQTGPLFVRNHIVTQGSAPTVAVQSAAGSGASASITGHDMAMSLTLVTGASATSAGDLAIITFNLSYATTPLVSLTPVNAAAATLFAGGMWVVKAGATLQVWCAATPADGATCVFDILTLA
jgi:hypothetical protein